MAALLQASCLTVNIEYNPIVYGWMDGWMDGWIDDGGPCWRKRFCSDFCLFYGCSSVQIASFVQIPSFNIFMANWLSVSSIRDRLRRPLFLQSFRHYQVKTWFAAVIPFLVVSLLS